MWLLYDTKIFSQTNKKTVKNKRQLGVYKKEL